MVMTLLQACWPGVRKVNGRGGVVCKHNWWHSPATTPPPNQNSISIHSLVAFHFPLLWASTSKNSMFPGTINNQSSCLEFRNALTALVNVSFSLTKTSGSQIQFTRGTFNSREEYYWCIEKSLYIPFLCTAWLFIKSLFSTIWCLYESLARRSFYQGHLNHTIIWFIPLWITVRDPWDMISCGRRVKY